MNSSFKENCRQWILCLALILGLVSANVSQAQSSDSDGDGVNDPVEIADGTNPNDASSFNNLNQGLAAYFPLSNTYQDLTGNLSSISPNGTSFSSNQRGELNGAISFNTSQNARIRGLSSVLSGDVMTFSGWFYYNAGIGHPMEYGFGFKQYLYSETAADGSHPEFRINLGGDPYNALQINLGGNSIIRPGITPEFGKWYHWAITVKAGVNKGWSLYSNGQFVASGTSEAPDRLEWPSDFGIGGSIEGGNFYWGTPSNGRVNNLRFYNRTLSASEIGQLYQQEAGSLDTDGDGLTDAWESGYGRYSLIGVNSLSWGQAKADAEARGGHLATITSAEEWTRIYQIVGDQTFDNVARAFLGGRQISKANEPAGGWEWITGEPWAYTNFATAQSQPDNRGNLEDYLEILGKREPSPFFWNDHYQNTDHYLLEFGYPTDPTKADTDGDGVDDKTESLAGTDPNDSTINSWDFVHSYKNVYSSNALDYVFDQQNIARVSEGGITYWSPAAGGQEARLTQKFVFNRPTASAFLHINYIYVASFSGAGSGSLWASKDGNEWTQLVDAPTPSFAAGYGFNDYLPKNLMGSNEIWIQARLQSSGWNIMAQFLRYDAAWRTDNAFDLKVRLDSHDTSPPIITLIGSNPLEIYKGSAFTDPGAAVTDNRDATRAITGNGSVDTGTVGFYSLTYTTTDAAGNLAAPVTRTVSVVLDPAADEDGDGLTNGTEIAGGTNPYQKDSDGDGVNDPVEIADETNPNDPSSYNNLNKGLVAYYPFNGNANDESGNGYHATNIGGTFVVGLRQQNSGSLHFDGASAYAQSSISNLPLQNSPRTLSLWIKSELRPDLLANEHIVGYGSFPPTEGFGVGIYAGSGGRLFGYCSFNDIPADKYADSGWVHFVHVYDGLESRIYADGLLVGSLRQQLVTQGNDAFTLGARQATDSANQIVNFYRGSLDDVRLYNRALSSAEIALMYENQASSLDTDGDGLTDAWERGYGRFEVIPGNFTWDQAKADAESRGGHLATFTSNAEWETVAIMLSAYPSQILWLGATDREVEGTWRWVTGEPWSFYTWGQGQPDNSGDEDRLSIWMAEDGSSPGWNDFGAAWRGHLIPYVLETGYPTDPTKADTDGDGFGDRDESLAGTDPNDPAAYPVWENPTLVETISPSNGLGLAALDFADRLTLNQGWLATHQPVAGGQIHVLQRQANGTSFAQTIQPPDAVYTTGFGESLSINEAGVLFAQSPLTYRQIPHEGTAYLFSRSGNTYGLSSAWTEEAQTAGRFSMNGKILGDTLVVFKPAVWDYNIKCTIFVYRVSSSGQKELIGKIAQTDGTYQMGGVGLSSSHIAVHLTSSDSSKTPKLAIYSLIRDSSGNLTGVTNLQTLDVSGTHEGDRDCLDIEGDWMALGDRQADMVYAGSTQAQAGRVTIFHRDSGGVWSPQQTLLSPQLAAGENFGECLVIQGGRLYVGSPGTAANGGKPLGVVYAYKLEGGRAVLKSIVRPSQSMSSTEIFGSALAKTPAVLAVGSTGGLRQSVSGGIYLYQIAEPDALAPLITLIGANPLEIYKGATFTDPGATVTDNVDETRTITGSGTVDASSVGIYTFTYTATDAAGNLALPVTRTVNVVLDPAADEDGDGLSNGTEISGGTNPYQKDSDGDGVNDPVEIADGTNPNDSSSFNGLGRGLVAYFPLDGNAQNSFGPNGIKYGATSTEDRFGNANGALNFNGINQYVDCGPMIPNYENATLSVWALVDPACPPEAGILTKPRFSWGTGLEIRANCGSYGVTVGFNNWLDNLGLTHPSSIQNVNQWHHYVVTTDVRFITYYVDGVKVNELPFVFQDVSSSYNVVIGAGTSGDHSPGNYTYFSGLIDDVRIYSRALSSNEVGHLYQQEAGTLDSDGDGLTDADEATRGTNPNLKDTDSDGVNDPVEIADGTNPNDASSFNNLNKGLVAYYPFNGNANDESGNGNHGISVGTASDSDRTGEDNKAQRFSSASRSRIEIPWQSSQVVGITCFSFWFKTAGAIDQARFVISGSAGYDFVFHLTSAARIDGLRFIPSPYVVIDSTEPYEAGIWNHVVAVSGANTTEQGIWLNGKKIQSVNTLGDPALESQHGSNRLWIGGSIDVPEADIRYFDGWIDDVRIYSRALSSNEVGQLYQNEAGSLDTDGDGLTDAWERGYGRYQIIPGNFTWEQAKADAEARGGHLVTITSQDEWNMIWSLLGPSWGSTVYWMGGTDQGTDGNWRWVTGENWSFNRWYPSQPSGGGEHQLLSSGNLPDGQPGWNDGFGMYQPGNFGGYLLEFGYPTDPNLADTDGDGFNDKVESLGGGDPNNPASLPQLIANNDTVDRDGRSGSSTAIALSQLLGNDQYTTPTPPTVSLPSRTTAQGGSVLLENGWVIYTGLSGLASSAGDSFGYRITDSLGNKADGMVFLNAGIYSSGVNIVRVVGATPPATGVISYFAVIPNKRYTVYATSSLSPVNWSNLGTFTSDSKGQLAVPDPIVASSRFYKMEVLFP